MKNIFIDVREPDEYQTGHVDGALNIPLDKIIDGAEQVVTLPKDSYIVVYCRSGSRSDAARSKLNSLGYANVTNGINKEHVEARFDIS